MLFCSAGRLAGSVGRAGQAGPGLLVFRRTTSVAGGACRRRIRRRFDVIRRRFDGPGRRRARRRVYGGGAAVSDEWKNQYWAQSHASSALFY